MKFTIRIAGLLDAVLLAGCDADDNNPATAESSRPVAYPSVDASFLPALECATDIATVNDWVSANGVPHATPPIN